ncbi:MAG: hypothetical protein WCK64_07790 [Synechococcaceae cyanobacterium ELA445]
MERKPFKRQNRKRMKVAAGKRMDADNQTAQQRTYDNRAPSRLSITVPASVLVALVERSEKEGCSISHLATCLLKQSLIQGKNGAMDTSQQVNESSGGETFDQAVHQILQSKEGISQGLHSKGTSGEDNLG